MKDQTLAWLRERADNVPPALAARMESAVSVATGASIAAVLSEAARQCLYDAMATPDSRVSALDLLAADALVTYACESAIDENGIDDTWSTESLSRTIELVEQQHE